MSGCLESLCTGDNTLKIAVYYSSMNHLSTNVEKDGIASKVSFFQVFFHVTCDLLISLHHVTVVSYMLSL